MYLFLDRYHIIFIDFILEATISSNSLSVGIISMDLDSIPTMKK